MFELAMYNVRFRDGDAIRIGIVETHNLRDGTLIVGRWDASTNAYERYAMDAREVVVKCKANTYVHPYYCPHDASHVVRYRGLLCGFCAAIATDESERDMQDAIDRAEAESDAAWARMVPWG
jgi:hypothetical protein